MKFCYINTENIYPQDRHLIDGLRENGHDVFELSEKTPGFRKYLNVIKHFWVEEKAYDAVFVGFTSPFFVVAMRLTSTKKIFFNAGQSQYEANIISRNENGLRPLKIFKWWIIDFISFHLSSLVLLESNAQIEFIRKLFFVPKRKLVRSWAGVNEKEFFYDPKVKKRDVFTALFRGRFLPESGILTILEAAKKLENDGVRFLVIGHGFMYREVNSLMDKLKPSNIEMITEKIPIEELRKKMLECHLSLGQMADHPRLKRTLPCKLFESLAMKLPYLTGKNAGALELLEEGKTCFMVEPGNSTELAQKIIFLKNNPEILKDVAEEGYKLYAEKLTSAELARNFVEMLKKRLSRNPF